MPIRRHPAAAAATTLTATLIAATVIAATVGLLPAAASAQPAAAGRSGPTQVVVTGHGYGHGRGMSQWGAEEAARRGVDHEAILDHYYPGTVPGQASGPIRVWIRGDLSNDVQVVARGGLTARRVGLATAWRLDRAVPRAKRWRVLPQGDGASVLDYLTRRWHRYRTVPGTLELGAGGRPVTLVADGGRTAAYRGVLRSVPSSPGNRITVNVLPLEAYLRGVVPAETYASTWQQETLRAQAVAARSYAVHRRDQARPSWDVDDTQATQAYGGASAEYPTTDLAVRATDGEIRTYDGVAAFTEFSASNGGWRAAGDAPYLTAAPDDYETAGTPHHDWTVTLPDTGVEAAYPAVGDLQSIMPGGRDGNGEWGGRVGTVTIAGTAGSVTTSGAVFAAALGLRSTWFDVTLS